MPSQSSNLGRIKENFKVLGVQEKTLVPRLSFWQQTGQPAVEGFKLKDLGEQGSKVTMPKPLHPNGE